MKVCVEAYLFEGLFDSLLDRNAIPYMLVAIDNVKEDRECSVPMDYVENGFITLNLNASAIVNFNIDKEHGYVSFSARFNGISQDIIVPIECILQVFDREEKIPFNMTGTCTIMPDLLAEPPVFIKKDVPKKEAVKENKAKPSFLKVVK